MQHETYSSRIQHQLLDFNGDGLADLLTVVDDATEGCKPATCTGMTFCDWICVEVYPNVGQGFAAAPTLTRFAGAWDYPGIGLTWKLPDWPNYDGITEHDLADINGDGLPDWIVSCSEGWFVQLNTGGQLEPFDRENTLWCPDGTEAWPGASGPIRKTRSSGLRENTVDLLDIDGDGLIDHVDARSASAQTPYWEVRRNLGAVRPHNDQNAVIEITYDSLGRKTELVDPDSGPPGSPGVWRYAYDRAGRLIAQDDPQTGQSVHFCYDLEGRMTQKLTATGDTLGPVDCGSPPAGWARVVYTYDTAANYGIDRLHRVTEADGIDGTEWSYHPRGLPYTLAQSVGGRTATFIYRVYDSQDRLLSLSYPDCETVAMRYDATGQPNWVSGSDVYIAGARYDVYGRLLSRTHTADSARQVVETHTYHGAGEGVAAHRLGGIRVVGPQGIYLNLSYPEYTARGFLAEIDDARFNSDGDPRSSDATFTYDDPGRLTAVDSPRPGVAETFSYDALGNLTSANGVSYTYEAAKPHQVSRVGGTDLTYGLNGNLELGRGGQDYDYDPEDRLRRATVGATTMQFAHDHVGAKVKQEANGTERRYYGGLVEVSGTEMTKVYFLGGQRVATNRVAAPAALLGIVEPAVQVGGDAAGERLVLVVTLRPDVQLVLVAVVLLGTAGLLAWAGRRRARVVGVRLRAGTVVLVVLVTGAGVLPVRWLIAPVWAGGGGGQRCEAGDIQHYHYDHLGSVQVLTGFYGEAVEHVRYTAYGAIRYRSTATEESLTQHRFTEYEHEPLTGLADAGARFYDPQLAIFLKHDPARQFANPYAYGPWNPVNGTDPTGTVFGVDDAVVATVVYGVIIGFAVGFTVSAIQAGVNGASFSDALKAGAIGGAIGGVTAGGLTLVGIGVAALGNPALNTAFNLATVGSGVYSTVEGFRTGQYVVGAVGVVMLAYGINQLAQGANGGTDSLGGKQFADSQQGTVLNDAGGGEGFWSDYFEVRPENGDGYLTLGEAKWQYQNAEGAPVTVDANKLDLSGLGVSDFPRGPGSVEPFALPRWRDFMVHGTVSPQLNPNSTVSILPDRFNFDLKPWSTHFTRNVYTLALRTYVGSGTPYPVYFRGTVTIGP